MRYVSGFLRVTLCDLDSTAWVGNTWLHAWQSGRSRRLHMRIACGSWWPWHCRSKVGGWRWNGPRRFPRGYTTKWLVDWGLVSRWPCTIAKRLNRTSSIARNVTRKHYSTWLSTLSLRVGARAYTIFFWNIKHVTRSRESCSPTHSLSLMDTVEFCQLANAKVILNNSVSDV